MYTCDVKEVQLQAVVCKAFGGATSTHCQVLQALHVQRAPEQLDHDLRQLVRPQSHALSLLILSHVVTASMHPGVTYQWLLGLVQYNCVTQHSDQFDYPLMN